MSAVTAFSLTQIVVNIIQTHTRREPSLISWTLRGFPTSSAGFPFDCLARALLLLANFGKDGRPEPIIAKVSQETLAEMIGTTRSRVSFFMNKFRKLGLIDYNGQIEIHTSLLNVVLQEEPHISA